MNLKNIQKRIVVSVSDNGKTYVADIINAWKEAEIKDPNSELMGIELMYFNKDKFEAIDSKYFIVKVNNGLKKLLLTKYKTLDTRVFLNDENIGQNAYKAYSELSSKYQVGIVIDETKNNNVYFSFYEKSSTLYSLLKDL